MRIQTRGLVVAGWLCVAPLAAAQEQRGEQRQVPPPPEADAGAAGAPATGGAPRTVGLPAPPPSGPTQANVRGSFRPPAAGAPTPTRLAEARLVSMEDGTARLEFPDGSALVKRGSVVGGDVVKSVQGRQIILDRPAAPGDARGDGVVVATFGPDGRPRVRVFWTRDPSVVPAAVN